MELIHMLWDDEARYVDALCDTGPQLHCMEPAARVRLRVQAWRKEHAAPEEGSVVSSVLLGEGS
jgi:hypothetical protein